MKNNTKHGVIIAIGDKKTNKVTNQQISWKEMVDKLNTISFSQTKEDGRAYIGGYVKDETILAENVSYRTLITLDIDGSLICPKEIVADILGGYEYFIHQTYSHAPNTEKGHRYRVIIPTLNAMSPEQFGQISRSLGELINERLNNECIDNASYVVSHFMDFPRYPRETKPFRELVEGSLLDVPAFLEQNPCKTITKPKTEPYNGKKIDLGEIINRWISPDCYYNEWIKIGQALKAEDYAFNVWDDWSALGSKYVPGDCQKKWHGFKRSGISGGTIIYYAEQNGMPKRERKNITEENNDLEEKYTFDDLGNARRLTDKIKEFVKYNYNQENFYVYNNKIWKENSKGFVKKQVYTLVDEMKKQYEDVKKIEKHISYSRSTTGINNMISLSCPLLEFELKEFDMDDYSINLQNGYYNLTKNDFLPHDKDKMFTQIVNIEYDPEAYNGMWEKFIRDSLLNDTELIEYVQKAVGYTLAGGTEKQTMFILLGDGNNGKSVFQNIISKLLGTYSDKIDAKSLLKRKFESSTSSDIAKLANKRFVQASEPDQGSKLQESLVKQLTGDSKITASFKHKNEFTYTPKFKIWMDCNYMPRITGTDVGIWRRMAIIPFENKVAEKDIDPKLQWLLEQDLPGILNWAIEGYQKYKKDGLKQTISMEMKKTEFKTEMNTITLFLEECCEEVSYIHTKSSDLYLGYTRWTEDNGFSKMNSTNFGKEIGKKYEKKKTSGIIKYTGIQLKSH